MSVSVSMPQLGESVTEGTVTRWLKREGERVEADEPLLEVSTDKVDTEIPSPVSGILRGITVAEDETVAVGAELAVIDEEGAEDGAVPAAAAPAPPAAAPAPPVAAPAPPAGDGTQGYNASSYQSPYQEPYRPSPGYQPPPPAYQPPAPTPPPAPPPPAPPTPPDSPAPITREPAAYQPPPPPAPPQQAAPPPPAAEPQPAYRGPAQPADGVGPQLTSGTEGPYVTPLVRKLAAEHGIDLATVTGTGVGGRIRKQDVLDAARVLRGTTAAPPPAPPQAAPPPPPPQQQAAPPAPPR
ncbi:MAG TPA: biotin/lipoyl-containing protein, partial [Streptosporangiaceae bacterium]|nr:biotin/lipoyl-containing protein [Streptosporangiaceae bacterium]